MTNVLRTISAPYTMTNYVRWSIDGQSIVGRLAPNVNPNAAYPVLITSDGEILFCDYEGRGYAWGVGGTKVITNDLTTNQVILIDMETCAIEDVLYKSDEGLGDIIVSVNHGIG